MKMKNWRGSVGVLVVVHVANVPIEAVLALDLVRTHWTGELRFDAAFVALVLYQGTSPRVASATTRTYVWLVLDQRTRSGIVGWPRRTGAAITF